jgi:hypothetical protein
VRESPNDNPLSICVTFHEMSVTSTFFSIAGYRSCKHKTSKAIPTCVMDSHIGPDNGSWCVHILVVSKAKWDAFRAHADKFDRKGKGETLS